MKKENFDLSIGLIEYVIALYIGRGSMGRGTKHSEKIKDHH